MTRLLRDLHLSTEAKYKPTRQVDSHFPKWSARVDHRCAEGLSNPRSISNQPAIPKEDYLGLCVRIHTC